MDLSFHFPCTYLAMQTREVVNQVAAVVIQMLQQPRTGIRIRIWE